MIAHDPQLRLCRACLLIACAVITPGAACAQDVLGGIEGTAADSSGTPLAGVRVSVVGTVFAATVDSAGRYVIDHVPAGEYTIRAELSGQRPTTVPAVLVPAGGTVQVNFAPPARATVAPPQLATSGMVFSGGLLGDLPIDDARQALVLVPGVVMRGGQIGIADAADLSVRGADLGSASVYIDGAPVRFETLGTDLLAVGTNAISQASVVTGIPSPLASDARGGVISYVTRAGGARFAGTFRATGDGASPDGSSVGYNRFEGAIGGPLPVMPHLTWFVSGTLYGQRSAYRGLGAADQPSYVMGGVDTIVTVNKADGSGLQSVAIPQFVQYSGECANSSNYGFDCQGLRRPMDWSTSRREQARLLYTYGAGSSLSLTGLASELQQRFSPGPYVGDPALYAGARATSRLAVVNWTHRLRQLSNGPLTLDVNMSVAADEQLSGVLDPASEFGSRDPALGIELSTLHFTAADILPFPLTDQVIRNVRSNQGLRVPYLGRSDLLASQPYRMNPYGLSSFEGWYTTGVDAGQALTDIWERRWNGRAFVEWRPGRAQQLSVGLDLERTDLSSYTTGLTDEVGLDAFLEHPRRLGLFADYKVQTGALLIDAGARYDRFDPGAEFANIPGRISTNPAWSPRSFTSDTAYAGSLARVFTAGAVKNAISPRVRLTYAVSARTSARLAYALQVEPPAFGPLFANVNSDLAFTNVTTAFFGRDVDYVKSTLLEAGARMALGHFGADVSVYRKGNVDPYVYHIETYPDPSNPGAILQLLLLTANRGEVGTGVDAQLEWRHGTSAAVSLAGSAFRQPSPGAGVPGYTTSAVTGSAVVRIPDTWRAGTALGAALAKLSAVAMFRATTGLPYTRLANAGIGIIAPAFDGGTGVEPINSSRLPVTKTLDVKLTKAFRVRGMEWSVYADVRNVLNSGNMVGAYAETGTGTNDRYRANVENAELAAIASEATQNGARLSDGSVDLHGCASWTGDAGPVDCVALQRVEARFGDGNGIYSPAEQHKALDSYFDSFFGAWRFFAPGGTARLGVELAF